MSEDSATFDLAPPTGEQFDELAAGLDEAERHVLLQHGTEAPFCGVFLDEKRSYYDLERLWHDAPKVPLAA